MYNATYDFAVSLFELFDGYKGNNIAVELIEKNSGVLLRTGIELHDECANYLRPEVSN